MNFNGKLYDFPYCLVFSIVNGKGNGPKVSGSSCASHKLVKLCQRAFIFSNVGALCCLHNNSHLTTYKVNVFYYYTQAQESRVIMKV